MTLAPSAISAIIACGCGIVPTGDPAHSGRQEEAETKAAFVPCRGSSRFYRRNPTYDNAGRCRPFRGEAGKVGAVRGRRIWAGSGYEIAAAIVEVCHYLHIDEPTAWTFTPRRLFAYCDVIRRNRTARYIELIQLASVAQDAKATAKQVKEWSKEV
jgi:hypothetical protein